MTDFSFKTWLAEWADFGFDKLNIKHRIPQDMDERPLHTCDIEYVFEQMARHKLGPKKAQEPFLGEIVWGEGAGAVKIIVGPFGGMHGVVRKQISNLLGEKTWICKRTLEVGNYYDQKEDTLVQKFLKLAEEVDAQQIDAPKDDYEGLERLVMYMADTLRRNTTQRVFIYEGIRKLTPGEHYIIHFGVTGMGVQRQDQKRLDQMQVEVKYEKQKGTILVAVNELGGPIKSHPWKLDQSQILERFVPSQPKEEIAGCILSLFNCY